MKLKFQLSANHKELHDGTAIVFMLAALIIEHREPKTEELSA